MSVGVSDFGITDLETCLNAKKKCVNTIYFCSTSYKKPKKSVVSNMVDLFAGFLSLENVDSAGIEPMVFWRNNISSVVSNINDLLNINNIKNTVVEKTSYADLNVLANNENMDETMPKKTHTQIYMLGHLLKAFLFIDMNDNNNILALLFPKFVGTN
ncbi:hypothetical protein G9A89_021537 [Geosiphon pyriformis]|nr:hypothetical protein G9A89_021537 [Geosiphon pyriformis]